QSRICAVVACLASQTPFLAAFRAPDATVISRGTGTNIFDVAQLQANAVVNENAESARFDWKINQKNSAYFRFFRDDGRNLQPYTPFTLSFIDNLNYTRGSHNFRMGGELRVLRLYTDRQGGTTYTYASLQNFLAGNLQSIQFTGDLSATSPFTGVSGIREAKQ